MIRTYRENINHISTNAKKFLVGNALQAFALGIYSLLFNLYLHEQGLTDIQIGQVLSKGGLGACLVALPAAYILEKYRVKHILIACIIGAAMCCGLQPLFHNSLWPKILTFAFTMFTTTYTVSVAPFFMRNSTAKERVHLFTFSASLIMFSQLLAFYVGGFLPSLLKNIFHLEVAIEAYEFALYLCCALTFLSLIPFFTIQIKPIPATTGTFLKRLKNHDWKNISKLIIPRVFVGIGAGFTIPFLNLYLKKKFFMSTQQIGMSFALVQAFVFVGILASPVIVKKFNLLSCMVITSTLSIPFMFILAVTTNIQFAIFAMVMRGMLMNMSAPVTSNFEMEMVGEHEQNMTTAISYMGWNAGWSVSAFFAGNIFERFGFESAFFASIVFYLLSIICYVFFFRNHKGVKMELFKKSHNPQGRIA
jgi:MFS family permease